MKYLVVPQMVDSFIGHHDNTCANQRDVTAGWEGSDWWDRWDQQKACLHKLYVYHEKDWVAKLQAVVMVCTNITEYQ